MAPWPSSRPKIVPSITFEIRRDREEEMIHRGVQYSRAIRAYYKKFGHYPTKLEDLEDTNQSRYLRKRYKDPLNCKNGKCGDFKLLHFGEVQMTLSAYGRRRFPARGSRNRSTWTERSRRHVATHLAAAELGGTLTALGQNQQTRHHAAGNGSLAGRHSRFD